MPSRARIKILECKSFEEVERKVNDFLAFSEDIEHVTRIVYQLEYNVVIVEYYVFGQEEKRGERKGKEAEYYDYDYNNFNKMSVYDLTIMSYMDIVKCWINMLSLR